MTRPYVADGQFYRRELEGFADSILNNKPLSGADVNDGIAAMQALVATYESMKQGGRKIYLKDVEGGL